MDKITLKQMKEIKAALESMRKSDEQFILLIHKKPNGEDNIIQYSYNIPLDKLGYYFKKAINSGNLKDEI